jgi:hypothetical protein
MINSDKEKLYLVTGISVAIDAEDGILIAGVLSDTPFAEEHQESENSKIPVVSFAFTRKQAAFLRDRFNEFLQ